MLQFMTLLSQEKRLADFPEYLLFLKSNKFMKGNYFSQLIYDIESEEKQKLSINTNNEENKNEYNSSLESSDFDLRSRKRGPYKKYELELKEKAIFKVKNEGKSLKEVSIELDVPAKNLKRWLDVGAKRRKGYLL